MKRKDGISIIVPVYNAEKYLENCLTTLLNQKIENYEILLIDDGSKDQSLKICEDFAKKDKKIRVFHTENQGVALARNFALKKAKYEYLCFADADDWVTPDFLETVYEKTKEHYDIITFDAYEIPDGWKEEDASYRPCFLPTEKNTKKDFVLQSTEPSFLWCRCFHYTLFEKYQFPLKNEFYTDSATVPILIMNAKKICHIQKTLYYYRQNATSIVHHNTDQRILGIVHAWERIFEETPKTYEKEIAYAIYYSICAFLNFKPMFCDEFLDFYRQNQKRFQKNPYIEEKIETKQWIDLSKKKLVPKKIHYFWFGGEKPKDVLDYIETWKEFASDYEIKEWNETNCNLEENDYVKEAYQEKKYAFVSDYFRIKVLYEEGGIYLDTDMEVKKRMDFLRTKELSFPMETDSICAGFISACPKNPKIKEILDGYEGNHFILEDGSYNFKTIVARITEVLEKYYKISYLCQTIEFPDLTLYSPDVFLIDVGNGKNVAEHHYKATWWDVTEGLSSFKYNVLKYYFETLYKEEERKKQEIERKRIEEEERKKQEYAYEHSLKRRIYKNTVKGLKKVLPSPCYRALRKTYRKIKPRK